MLIIKRFNDLIKEKVWRIKKRAYFYVFNKCTNNRIQISRRVFPRSSNFHYSSSIYLTKYLCMKYIIIIIIMSKIWKNEMGKESEKKICGIIQKSSTSWTFELLDNTTGSLTLTRKSHTTYRQRCKIQNNKMLCAKRKGGASISLFLSSFLQRLTKESGI